MNRTDIGLLSLAALKIPSASAETKVDRVDEPHGQSIVTFAAVRGVDQRLVRAANRQV